MNKRELSALRIYGCTQAEALALNDGLTLTDPKSKANAYGVHRRNAAKRGVAWEITFPDWLRVWLESGHWQERGRERGKYSMARHGDIGPYHPENVSIQLSAQNTGDALRRQRKQGSPCNTVRAGSGRGWKFVKRNTKRPYVALLRKKYLGAFATQAEAEAAHQAAVQALHAEVA